MSKRRSLGPLPCWLLSAGVLMGGCGTTVNVSGLGGAPRIYGGFALGPRLIGDDGDMNFGVVVILFLPFFLADLPLSFVGDTVTLPYVLRKQVERRERMGELSPALLEEDEAKPRRRGDAQKHRRSAPGSGGRARTRSPGGAPSK